MTSEMEAPISNYSRNEIVAPVADASSFREVTHTPVRSNYAESRRDSIQLPQDETRRSQILQIIDKAEQITNLIRNAKSDSKNSPSMSIRSAASRPLYENAPVTPPARNVEPSSSVVHSSHLYEPPSVSLHGRSVLVEDTLPQSSFSESRRTSPSVTSKSIEGDFKFSTDIIGSRRSSASNNASTPPSVPPQIQTPTPIEATLQNRLG